MFLKINEKFLSKSQIIESRGFIPETHHIMTSDGYILTIFRIINPRLNRSSNGYPIYLQHGFFLNSDNWLLTSPGILAMDGIYIEDNLIVNNCSPNGTVARTLPFVLSSCGYDVWLGNIRGNRYSSHIYLDENIGQTFNRLFYLINESLLRRKLLELFNGFVHQIWYDVCYRLCLKSHSKRYQMID